MDGGSSNGPSGSGHPRVGERVEQISSSAQQLYEDTRGAVTDLGAALDLKGRVQRHPYLTLAAAAGVGYLLGGGLFTRLTGRMVHLGLRMAALPFVKDEMLGIAESALEQLTERLRGEEDGPPSPGRSVDRSEGLS